MAYTPDFLYDVYIGHTAAETKYFESQQTWVESFEANLKIQLDERVEDTVRIYRSEDEFSSDRPNQAITTSAVFIAVTPPESTRSASCQLELEEFRRGLRQELPFGLLFETRGEDHDRGRVFEVSNRKTASFLGPNPPFDFYPGPANPTYGFLSPPTFESRIGELADEIAKVLCSLKDKSNVTSIKNLISSRVYPILTKETASLPPEIAWEPRNNASSDAGLVFVSYSKKDKTFAHELAKTLKQRGVRVWVDEWDIRAGAKSWRKSIDEGLTNCDSLLIVFSPSAVDSDEVIREADIAMNLRKPIVPVLYQSCQIPPRFNVIQHIDFRTVPPNDDEKMAKLVRDLEAARE